MSHHDCEHTAFQHGADGCNAPGCRCAFMSWCEEDYDGDVDAHVAAGEITTHETTEDFLAHLDALDAMDPADDRDDVGLTVCPEHLRFVPCRRCKPGEEQYSTDSTDVERARVHQQGAS